MTKAERIEKLGEVFTLPNVVKYMLDLVRYSSSENLENITILEPSAGDGSFAVEIVERLKRSSERFNFDLSGSLSNLFFVEINDKNIGVLKSRLSKECGLTNDQIATVNLLKGDFLIEKFIQKFDLVIGNPPYVRWDNLNDDYRKLLRAKFKTFRGRCDLYVPFYEKALSLLNVGGACLFICSNRWFKSSYGKQLRSLVISNYSILKVVDLETTNPFTEDVLGYPAITLIKKEKYSVTNFRTVEKLDDLFKNSKEIIVKLGNIKSDIWTFDNTFTQLLDSKFYTRIQDSGFKINIGIATGKDKVFISSDLSEKIENDRLVPIVKSKHLKNENFFSDLKVINCFDVKGNLIVLDKYPKLKKYLENFKDELKQRHIAKKNEKAWFRTIDKIKIKDINIDKILLPDISGSKKISLGGKGYYPHHNIYYITTSYSLSHLKVLAAILSSNFIIKQLALVGNKMNGGYPRWQSQNIRRLVIPNILAMNEEWKYKMAKAYSSDNIEGINFLMTKNEIGKSFVGELNYTLFEPEVKMRITQQP